jgi:hypothetical protein
MAKKTTKKSAEKPAAKKAGAKEVVKKVAEIKAKKNIESEEKKNDSKKFIEKKIKGASTKENKSEKVKASKETNNESVVAVDSEVLKKWQDLKKKYGATKAMNYKMTEVFESNQPLQHKVLGWGYVLSSLNDRLEVIFESGIRQLISNYKAR